MDWNDKFSSIVRETESNLEKVKQRLSSAKYTAVSSLSPPSVYNRAPVSSLSTRRVTFDQSPNEYNASKPSVTGLVNGQTLTRGVYDRPVSSQPDMSGDRQSQPSLDNSSAVSLFLHEQLNQQNKIIDQLKQEVKRLSTEHDQDKQELQALRAELSQVHNRVVERGVDFQTERKMEQWRRDLSSELQLMQSQMQSYRGATDNHQYSNTQLQSALRELQDVKRFVMDESQSVRREVDSLKTRLVKYEMDLTSLRTDTSEISRRVDRMDRHVREISDSQRAYKTDVTRNLDDSQHAKLQIHELRSSVRGLREKVSNVESQMFDSTKKQSLIPSKVDNRHKEGKQRRSKNHKKSLTTSDLDELSLSSTSGLSTLSLADYSSDDLSFTAKKPPANDLALDDLDLSDVPSLSASDLEL